MRLDIVIPAHNEAQRIGRTLAAYRRVIDDPDVRFVVALDACTDNTGAVVAAHMREDERVTLISYPKLGKGGVVCAALRDCDADLLGYVDADGATPPRELLRLADAATAAPMPRSPAAGTRPPSSGAATADAPRRLARFLGDTRLMLGLPHPDTQCGAKVMRREAAHSRCSAVRTSGLSFDVDLLLAARDLATARRRGADDLGRQGGLTGAPAARHAPHGRLARGALGAPPDRRRSPRRSPARRCRLTSR